MRFGEVRSHYLNRTQPLQKKFNAYVFVKGRPKVLYIYAPYLYA